MSNVWLAMGLGFVLGIGTAFTIVGIVDVLIGHKQSGRIK